MPPTLCKKLTSGIAGGKLRGLSCGCKHTCSTIT